MKRLMLSAACLAVVLQTRPATAAGEPPIPGGAAVDFQLTPAQIKANCAREIARFKARVLAVENVPSGQRTFQNVVLPLENAGADLNDALTAENVLSSVSSDKAVRDASNDCANDQAAIGSELGARPQALKAVEDAKASGTATTDADKQLLAYTLDGYQRSGAGLAPEQRAEFVKLSQQMADLQIKFQTRVNEDQSTIVISEAETKGLSADFVATLKKDATGNYIVPVNESTIGRFMRRETVESARERYYFAYNKRGGEENVRTLESIIAIRSQLASLLGYKSWAAFQISNRMAKSPARVESLLDELTTKLTPIATSEYARIAARKAQLVGQPSATLSRWDVSYYSDIIRRTDYALDSEAIRKYFPAQHTIDQVMAIYSRILGVSFKRVTPAHPWTEKISEFAVSDTKTGTPVGTLYLDLLPRPGKYEHFANFPLQPGRVVNGAYRPATTAIIGNWAEPPPGHEATLSRDEVETFFHEFGHAMAALLTTAPYETLSGGYRLDFVEAPSQMLENWTYDPTVLKELSSEVGTGAPIPDALIQKIVAEQRYNEAINWMAQIMYSRIDLAYHTSGPKVDTTAVWYNIAAQYPGPHDPPGLLPQAAFTHLTGGYSAGYYSYVWSKVYAQDLFTAFKAGGLESPIVGARYRKYILEPAQIYEPDVLVQNFLGRPISEDAFLGEFTAAPAAK
jgi:thimet oligopeptidase